MPSIHRVACLGLVALASLAACSRPAEPPPAMTRANERIATVATFEGRYDPATGALTFSTTPADSMAEGPLGRVAFIPYRDGKPGGPRDTLELANGSILGSDMLCGGSTASWEGEVSLKSYYETQSFSDVAVEILSITGGFEACNSVLAYGGMSATLGLWDYGSIGPGASKTETWRFNRPSDVGFTFTGRVMATLGSLPAPANGGSSFEWSPYMFMDPPHSFKDVGTTLSHVIWDGSSFVDTRGVVTFLPAGATAPNHPVGLAYPVQQWAGPFPNGADRYEASPSPAALNLTGDFTVCVKFKPGVNPEPLGRKVLVAKGNPVDMAGPGWALTQQHGPVVGGGAQYGFFYITLNDGNSDTYVFPGDHPENSTFDYTCAGRSGDSILVVAHGRETHFANPVSGIIPGEAGLPLVIGAAAGGAYPATDAGVYEVIFDSRGATMAVMNDIVDRAEGRKTYNGASYDGNDVDALAVAGVDGLTYHFPVGATAPVSTDGDGSGLLDAGTSVAFGGAANGLTGVLPPGTSGYCVGADIANPLDVDFASAAGYILTDSSGYLRILILGDGTVIGVNGNAYMQPKDIGLHAWEANTRHTLRVCATTAVIPGVTSFYVDSDAELFTSDSLETPLADLTNGQLLVGSNNVGGSLLTGARVGRVFACPTADPTLCH
jgi:hypothetical protein